MLANDWSPTENDVLRIAAHHGWNPRDVARFLPGRTREAVANRLEFLRIAEGAVSLPEAPRRGRWNAEEDHIIEACLAMGLKQGDIEPLVPGRNLTQVQNRIRILRCRQRHECFQCGGPLPDEHPGPKCDGCTEMTQERNKLRYEALRRAGMCTMCATNPADASLTLCESCLERNRLYLPAPKVSRNRQPHQGLIRWIGSPAMVAHIRRFPKDVQVVDLFGGSAAYAIRSAEEGFKVSAYNDIHPGLHALVSAVVDGEGPEVYRLCRQLESKTPQELVSLYQRANTLHREGLAAVTFMAARSSIDKNLRNPRLDEIYPTPDRKGMLTRFRKVRETLTGVEVLNLDYLEAIDRLDGPDTLFFCDPPYPGSAKFEHNLTGRHDELVDRLSRVEGRYFLVFNSSRRAAELMRRLPFVYRSAAQLGPLRIRELVATNYPLEDDSAEPMDFAEFGL